MHRTRPFIGVMTFAFSIAFVGGVLTSGYADCTTGCKQIKCWQKASGSGNAVQYKPAACVQTDGMRYDAPGATNCVQSTTTDMQTRTCPGSVALCTVIDQSSYPYEATLCDNTGGGGPSVCGTDPAQCCTDWSTVKLTQCTGNTGP